jgi:hypothetical protein
MTRTLRIRRTPIILMMLAVALLLIAAPMHKAQATDDPPVPPISVDPDTTTMTGPGGDSPESSGPSLLDLMLASLLALATV